MERTPIELPMIRHGRLREWVIAPENNVGAVLPADGKPKSLQCADHLGTRDLRQLAHTASRSASKCSSGTGKPSSRKTMM